MQPRLLKLLEPSPELQLLLPNRTESRRNRAAVLGLACPPSLHVDVGKKAAVRGSQPREPDQMDTQRPAPAEALHTAGSRGRTREELRPLGWGG